MRKFKTGDLVIDRSTQVIGVVKNYNEGQYGLGDVKLTLFDDKISNQVYAFPIGLKNGEYIQSSSLLQPLNLEEIKVIELNPKDDIDVYLSVVISDTNKVLYRTRLNTIFAAAGKSTAKKITYKLHLTSDMTWDNGYMFNSRKNNFQVYLQNTILERLNQTEGEKMYEEQRDIVKYSFRNNRLI